MKFNKDQRTHARRIPSGNVYAALGRDFEKVGKIIDLSLGGLGFEYIPEENQSEEFSQIDIFKVGEVFHLHNLPCKIAYDVPLSLPSNGIKSLQHSPSRRCGVEFKTLPEEDNAQLELFLELHTISDY
jgi:hypothetical protein